MSVDLRRGSQRFLTEGHRTRTRHSFSYGVHYDPDNVGFGPLRAINVESIEPGAGYDAHRHADVEIVTWVLSGQLRHTDSAGGGGVIGPGVAQRLSAGDGVEHAEVNDSDTDRLLFVQMMLASDHAGAPEYAVAEVPGNAGMLHPTVPLLAPASLLAVRLEPGQSVAVPAAPRSLVLVTCGALQLDDTGLKGGDEARLDGAGSYDLSAAGPGGEALIWQLET